VKKPNCIVVLGPTASGKTHLACELAAVLNGEIISFDSRQVYKGLTIGSGKDLNEYRVGEQSIPYHLIDIREPNEQYYLHEFVHDLKLSFEQVQNRTAVPILCGGTGLYLDALRKDFSFTQAPENAELREVLNKKSKPELIRKLNEWPFNLIQHVDVNSKKRIIRGIEVAQHLTQKKIELSNPTEIYYPIYFGLEVDRKERLARIKNRLNIRIKQGLIEEVQDLLEKGISHKRLQQLGLEYKFVSIYLQGKLNLEELNEKLYTAICQFSKRQMTWFRKMEREGVKINWVNNGMEISELIKKFELNL